MTRKILIGLFTWWAMSAFGAPEVIQGLNLIDGQEVKLSSSDKTGLAVIFLSAKCPCSDSHEPLLKKLAEDFPDVQFVGVHANADESLDMSTAYFKKINPPFPVIEDSKDEIANRLKAFKTPHAFLFQRDGKLIYSGGVTNSAQANRADKQFLRDALDDLKAGREIKTAEGRTLGCIILRDK